MIVAKSCGLTAVAEMLALLGQSFNTMRERLRDTYREANAKAGGCRSELEASRVLGAVAGLGAGRLVRGARAALCRARDQRGGSRLCGAGRLEDAVSH